MSSIRFFLVITILLFSNNLIAQNERELNCNALEKSLKSEIFHKVFSFCENKKNAFVIVDTNMFFVNCGNYDFSCREVNILHEWVKEKSANTVVVFRKIEDRKHFAFEFFCPYTGSAVMLSFKFKNNKVKIVNSRFGDY